MKARAAIAAAACAALVFWGAHGIYRAIQRQPNAAQLIAGAEHRIGEAFPPDWSGARSDLEEALRQEPLRSEAWFLLARTELGAGSPERAKIALSRAEELDPWYPRQRLKSILLWSLLDEPARAQQTARQVASYGGNHRFDSAKELGAMGLGTEEIFALVSDDALSPADTGRLLKALPPYNPEALRRIYASLSDALYSDADFRRAALERAQEPLLFDVIAKLWAMETEHLEEHAGIPADNLELTRPPFGTSLPLGWQPIPEKAVRGGGWLSPEVLAGLPHGVIRLEFNPVADEKQSPLQYRAYRTVMRAGSPVTIALKVRAPRQASAWLTVKRGGESFRSATVQLGHDWSVVSLSLPSSERDALLDILVEARGTQEIGHVSELLIGPLSFLPGEASE